MRYTTFCGERVSLLGFGAMRLPVHEDKSINYEATEQMIDRAIAGGINYFDTAYPYHSGYSETVVGKILAKYPRESYYLATKYPGHQIMETYGFHPEGRACPSRNRERKGAPLRVWNKDGS